jgi:hypothetical protein
MLPPAAANRLPKAVATTSGSGRIRAGVPKAGNAHPLMPKIGRGEGNAGGGYQPALQSLANVTELSSTTIACPDCAISAELALTAY